MLLRCTGLLRTLVWLGGAIVIPTMPLPAAIRHRPSRIRTIHRSRRRPVRHRAAVPFVAITIERSAAIIVVPVTADHEADDRDADLRAVFRQQHGLILVFVLNEIAGNPAATAVVGIDHIAPFPAIGAALHVDFGTGGKLVNQRIARIGAGTQIHVAGDIGIRRLCQRGEGQ